MLAKRRKYENKMRRRRPYTLKKQPAKVCPRDPPSLLSLSLSLSLHHRFEGSAKTVGTGLWIREAIMFRRKHNVHDNEESDAGCNKEKISELKAAIGPLSGRSLKYCSDPCLKRYMIARNWNVVKAKKMLEDSLKWRSAYKPEDIRWHEVAIEGETGKAYRANFHDKQGRTVLVMTPAKQNTTSHDNQLRHLVYLLENAILNLAEGQEQMVWLIDFNGWSLSNSVPIKTARETMNILQNHYPERLGAAFLYNPPRIFEAFWKVAKYFLDPITSQKVNFVYPKNGENIELLRKTFDIDTLPKEFGGRNDIVYNHEEFSRMVEKDEIKAAGMWEVSAKGLHDTDGRSTGIASEPVLVTSQAS